MRTLDGMRKTAATGGVFLRRYLADILSRELGLYPNKDLALF